MDCVPARMAAFVGLLLVTFGVAAGIVFSLFLAELFARDERRRIADSVHEVIPDRDYYDAIHRTR